MQSLQNIFSATLKENSENENLHSIISELTFELSKKKIQRLKDDKRIQKRLGELFEFYTRALQNENLKTSQNIDAIISGLVKAASYEKEEFLYKNIYEKEQLEKSIVKQKESIKTTIIGTLDILETHINKMDETITSESLKALHDTKLRSIEMLGILKETTSEAFLTTLEHAQDIEDTIFEITKNITYQTISEGEFTKNRFLDITSSIVEVAIELADEDQANAKELLVGTIHGTKEGLTKAIDKFKNDLKFAPEEMETILEKDLATIKKELFSVEEDFVNMLENSSKKSSGIAKEIINNLLENELNNSFAKIKRATTDTIEALSEKIDELNISESEFVKKAEKKIEELEKIASDKIELIKQNGKTKNVTKEAKRLGNHAWEVAKDAIDSAIKSAKDVINR